MQTPQLSDEIIIANHTIKNRFFKSAMSEQLGDRLSNPTPGLARVFETWAEGGCGLLVTGNVMVDRQALGEPKNVVLDEQSNLKAFKNWSASAKKNGTSIWMQLNHPGRQIPKFLTSEPVAPSAVPLGAGLESSFAKPRALEEHEIEKIIKRFAISARLAKESGFDGVQIHGAHGYLVSQFISPQTNLRNDKWGGSLDNRLRFVSEIYHAIRKEVGEDYPVGIKLNSADYSKGGISHEDAMYVVNHLSGLGIDLIEVSGGTYETPSMVGADASDSTLKREAYFLEFAESIRDKTDTTLVVTGGFRSAKAMQAALASGACDMIGLARPMAIQPDAPNHLLANQDYAIQLKRPSTGLKSVDKMTMLDIVWYEFQIERMANGKAPKANLSAWSTVAQTLGRLGSTAFQKRRA